MSRKTACSESCELFSKIFREEVTAYQTHIHKAKAQYRRIREVKKLALQPESTSKFLRIDWSENVELYQTVQEKSQYYYSISASVNTAVLYESGGVRSMATISDVKSHKAEATMASLGEIFGDGDVDLKSCKLLYIASDSPTSQYCNKKICFLMPLIYVGYILKRGMERVQWMV